MTKYPFPKSIEEAAAILDKDKPGWEKEINLSLLEMYKPFNCILGQLYGAYGNGIESLFNADEVDDSSGINTPFFGAKVDKNLWIEQINKRLDAKRDFTWALEQVRLGKKMCCDGATNQNYSYIVGNIGGVAKATASGNYFDLSLKNLIDYSRAVGWKEYNPKLMVKCGDRVRDKVEDIIYIVAQFSKDTYGLIDIKTGTRYGEPLTIVNASSFALEDILNFKYQIKDFELVK